jgi:hypothetical protein
MNQLDAVRAITRRALRIAYQSPLICQLEASSSGSGGSGISAFIPIERGPGPASLVADVSVCGQVTLNWAVVPGAIGYVVYSGLSPDGPWDPLLGVLLTENTLTQSLPPNTSLYIKVTAVNPQIGETLPSPVVAVTITPCE